MEIKQINEYIKKCHEASKSNGWSDLPESEPERSEWLADKIDLIASEGAEYIEGIRSGKSANINLYLGTIEMEEELSSPSVFLSIKIEIFERFIKDTQSDELADIFIRTCDLMGFNKYRYLEIKNISTFEDETTKEIIRNIRIMTLMTAQRSNNYSDGDVFRYVIDACIRIAENEDIDLEWHINAKLNYNTSRGIKHGKEF